jgi:hypothetical protein
VTAGGQADKQAMAKPARRLHASGMPERRGGICGSGRRLCRRRRGSDRPTPRRARMLTHLCVAAALGACQPQGYHKTDKLVRPEPELCGAASVCLILDAACLLTLSLHACCTPRSNVGSPRALVNARVLQPATCDRPPAHPVTLWGRAAPSLLQGRPIYIQLLGKIDINTLKKITSEERMVKFHIQVCTVCICVCVWVRVCRFVCVCVCVCVSFGGAGLCMRPGRDYEMNQSHCAASAPARRLPSRARKPASHLPAPFGRGARSESCHGPLSFCRSTSGAGSSSSRCAPPSRSARSTRHLASWTSRVGGRVTGGPRAGYCASCQRAESLKRRRWRRAALVLAQSHGRRITQS